MLRLITLNGYLLSISDANPCPGVELKSFSLISQYPVGGFGLADPRMVSCKHMQAGEASLTSLIKSA